MAGNHVLLNRIELNASAASITFSNIPQTGYTDLKIVYSTRHSGAADANGQLLTFNGVTTSYSVKVIEGAGSGTPTSQSGSQRYSGLDDGNAAVANTYSSGEIYVPNYTSSNYKSYSVDSVTENNTTAAYQWLLAGLWSNTAAITSVTLQPDNGSRSFMQYSTFSLYGVAATGTTPATAPKADGGNIIANDGTYWYHAFSTSGTFTPQTPISCDILQVAGGGGGGRTVGGGGGAGGLLAFTSQALTAATNYAVTIGAGGAGGLTMSVNGTNGGNSTFGALTASVGGGGGGGGNQTIAPSSGGSGGGAGAAGGIVQSGASGTSGQGNAGGTGTGTAQAAGGGGGANAVGGTGVANSKAGDGGVGLSTYSSWGLATSTGHNVSGTVYYAGGGGGGANSGASVTFGYGGYGGGADGKQQASAGVPTAALANTGGGGGGSGGNGDTQNGGNGGSGIVIIRYAMA